jgi:hypothetical protein
MPSENAMAPMAQTGIAAPGPRGRGGGNPLPFARFTPPPADEHRMSIGHFQAIVKIDSVTPSDSIRILAMSNGMSLNGMSLNCET